MFKQKYYSEISIGVLLINFIFQRIFRLNSDIPFSVSFTTRVEGFKRIKLPIKCDSIKKSFTLSGGCYITVMDGTELVIGEGTIWAFNVCIQTGNHGLLDRNEYYGKSIHIGKNCWIGNSVSILAGVELGDNVTVGANSVVTKSFPSNTVIAGCPAVLIKNLH